MTDRPLTYLRSAARSLRRTPGLSLAAIASLALGIGANAAIFAAFNQSLLQRLPIPHPEQLVTLSAPGDKNGRVSTSSSGRAEAVFSYPLFRDLEQGQQSFTGLAAHRDVPANVAHRGQTSGSRCSSQAATFRCSSPAGAGPVAVGGRRPDIGFIVSWC
jgi:hypothetical protein